MIRNTTFAIAVCAAPMALADSHGPSGDPEAGERAFRACISCHVVTDPDGNVLAGRNGRQGPNLYALAGRAAGSVDGFRYSSGMQAAGEAGLTWTEENFVGYLPNPTNFLREFTGEGGIRSSMTPQRVDEQGAADLYAFILSLAPPMEDMGEMEEGEEAASE